MNSQNCTANMCAFGLALGLMTTPLLAGGSSGWDTNADKKLDRTEFNTAFERAGVFNKWDANADGRLSKSEFRTGMSKHEQGFNARFGNEAHARWDINKDNTVSRTEFNDGLYAAYDRNRNNLIEEPELNDVGDDMGDGGLFDI